MPVKLSIIIPVLNEERYLPRLLESLRAQDFSNYEIIVSDAGSTDGTRRIAEERGARVVAGGLPARGRNAGAKESGGEVLLFLDADVSLPEGFLKNCVEEFERKNLGVATCTNLPLSENRVDKILYKSVDLYFKATKKFFPHSTGTCIFARKDIFEKLGGFREDIRLAEDHDLARRARKISRYDFLTPPIFNHVRRLERDGRTNIFIKYTLCELHRIFLGEVKSDIFHYKFAHYGSRETKKEGSHSIVQK